MEISNNSRVAIYARVSSEQQAEADTISSQIEALKQRVQSDGLSIDSELQFVDEGYSGATLVRPSLERLRDLASLGAVDCLYVHSPDGLTRKYAYQVLLVDEFQRAGVEIIFLDNNLGKTPEENLLLQVQGMVAEYERAKILERSRRGKLHAARKGSVNVLSGAPYGYRYSNCYEGNGEANYQIILEEARIVRQIFDWIGRDRLSIGEVCRRLKQQGVLTRTGKDYWDRNTIWGILKNPAYKGMAAFGKTRIGKLRPRLRAQRGVLQQPRRAYSIFKASEDEWIYIPVPAIVSETIFDTVQEQLAENKIRNRQSKRGARHLLQGLLVCKKCGYAYYGKPVSNSSAKGKKKDYAYYRCIGTDAYRFGGERICSNKQVRTDFLEQSVWEDVCSFLSDPDRIEHEYERRLTVQKKDETRVNVEQLSSVIKKVKRGIGRLIDAYEDGLLEKYEFEPRIRKAKERLEKLQAEAKEQIDEEEQRDALQLVIGCMKNFAEKVTNGLEQADWQTRRDIIRALIKQVEIDDEEVKIVYRVNPSPSDNASDLQSLQHCLRGGIPTIKQHISTLRIRRLVCQIRQASDERQMLYHSLGR